MEELLKIFEGQDATEILKAIEAGSGTGRDYNNVENTLGGLKVESLEPVVKSLLQKKADYRLLNSIPKQSVTNNVHQFNVQTKYGDEGGVFISEGETPEFSDPSFKRKSVNIAYLGVSGQVTLQATTVDLNGGKTALAIAQEAKTLDLMKKISTRLANGNEETESGAFNGIFKQHFDGLVDIAGMTAGNSEQKLIAFGSDVAVIDARGKALTETNLQDALDVIVNQRYGSASSILAPPTVFKYFAERFQGVKQIFVNGTDSTGNINTTVGQSVGRIQTQFGSVDQMSDIFFDRVETVLYNSASSNAKAPAIPVVGADPTAAVAADTKTKFTDGAGSYFYAVAAKNKYGRSAILILDTAAQAVAATESVDLFFTAGVGAYAADSFTIYRTVKDTADYTTAKFYPIFEVSVADLTAGFDGAAAGKVRDRNRFIANCQSAIVYDKTDADVLKYLQLMPISRFDYAQTSLGYRFSVINFATPQLSMPGKIVRIINLGSDLS